MEHKQRYYQVDSFRRPVETLYRNTKVIAPSRAELAKKQQLHEPEQTQVTTLKPKTMPNLRMPKSSGRHASLDGMVMKKQAKKPTSNQPTINVATEVKKPTIDIRQALADALRESAPHLSIQSESIEQKTEKVEDHVGIPEDVLRKQLTFEPAAELNTFTVVKSRIGDMLRI